MPSSSARWIVCGSSSLSDGAMVCMRFAQDGKKKSTAPKSTLRNGFENSPHHFIGGHAFALRGKIRHDAMSHDSRRDGRHVLTAHINLTTQNGVCLGRHNEVQARARPC